MAATQKQIDAAKTFLEGVVAKLPADKQQAFRDNFMNEDAVLASVGDGVMARGDYSRQTQALAQERQELEDWFAVNKPKVDQAVALLARNPNPDPDPDPPPPTVDPVKLKADLLADVTSQLDNRDKGGVKFFAALTDLAQAHQRDFGEPLDTKALVDNPRVYEIGLVAAHREIHAEKFEAKQQAGVQAKIDAALAAQKATHDAELAAARVTQPGMLTTSTRNPVMASLEELRTARDTNPETPSRPFANRVDEVGAAQEYQRLSQTTG